ACSQDEAFNTAASRWLTGSLGAGSTIEASAGKVSVKAAIKGETAQGTLTTSDGQTLKFTAKEVEVTGNAGLYRAVDTVKGDEMVAGWIVDEEGKIAGAAQNKNSGKVNVLKDQNKIGEVNAQDRKSTRLNSSHDQITYAVFC